MPGKSGSRWRTATRLAGAALALLLLCSAAPAQAAEEWPVPEGSTVLADPDRFAEQIAGHWTGVWGEMVFRVNPDGTVVGAYSDKSGVLVGWLDGASIDGWWCEPPSYAIPTHAGSIQFRLLETDGAVTLGGRWNFAYVTDVWNSGLALTRAVTDPPADVVERLESAEELCANPVVRPTPWTVPVAAFDADSPSVISSLPTAQGLGLTPERAAATAAASVVLVAVAAYPGILLESTLSANYDRLFGWAAPLTSGVRRAGRLASRIPRWVRLSIGIVLTLLISGLVDPRFGANWGSLRLLATLAIAIMVERVLAFWLIARVVRRTDPQAAPALTFRFGSLLLVAGSVLLARLTGFEPGIVFGLVFGLAFAIELGARREARVSLLAAGYAFVLGLAGWFGYSALTALAGASPSPPMLFAIETFGGFTVAGLAALPIALLPLAVTDGGPLFRWNRWAWLGCYLVALAAFLTIVLPLPASWDTVSRPFAIWIALYIGYAVLAVGVWAAFRFRPRPRSSASVTPPGAATG